MISISKSIIFNLVDKNLNYFDYLLLSSFLSWHEKKLNIFRGIREGKLLTLQFLWKKAQKRHKCGVKVTKCPENPFVEADLKLNNWETCAQFLPWLRIKYKLEKVFDLEHEQLFYRECVRAGAAGARTRRSLGHHLLHPLILRLLVLCAHAVLRPRALQEAPAPADPNS